MIGLTNVKKKPANYLRFIAEEPSYITLTKVVPSGSNLTYDIKWSRDGRNWQTLLTSANNVTSNTVSLPKTGDKIYLKGTYSNQNYNNYLQFIINNGKVAASGNINSLLDNNDGSSISALPSYCYQYLFKDCTDLTTAPELPTTTLANHCYYFMFSGCSSLKVVPVLPAIDLYNDGSYSYAYMFENCTSLTEARILPATRISDGTYNNMFEGCTSLVKAPEIFATTGINSHSMSYMFDGCSNLNYIKMHYTGNFGSYSFLNWVRGVSLTGNFYYNGNSTTRGNDAIPTNWEIHTF